MEIILIESDKLLLTHQEFFNLIIRFLIHSQISDQRLKLFQLLKCDIKEYNVILPAILCISSMSGLLIDMLKLPLCLMMCHLIDKLIIQIQKVFTIFEHQNYLVCFLMELRIERKESASFLSEGARVNFLCKFYALSFELFKRVDGS